MSLTVEFHCHTIFSKDSVALPSKLIQACRMRGIDRLIITDHNTISGALAAQNLDPELVIIGEEIRTTCGEILAAYVIEEIPRDLSPIETIKRLREQHAFIAVAHPMDPIRGWRVEHLLEIVHLVDAIEVFNSRCLSQSFNIRAAAFAQEYGIAGIAGSDAHALFELGTSTVVVPDFQGPEELRQVIAQGKIYGRRALPLAYLASRYARIKKMLGYNN